MKGDVSTCLDDWFDYDLPRLSKSDRVKLRALAVSERITPAEALRRAVRTQFRKRFRKPPPRIDSEARRR